MENEMSLPKWAMVSLAKLCDLDNVATSELHFHQYADCVADFSALNNNPASPPDNGFPPPSESLSTYKHKHNRKIISLSSDKDDETSGNPTFTHDTKAIFHHADFKKACTNVAANQQSDQTGSHAINTSNTPLSTIPQDETGPNGILKDINVLDIRTLTLCYYLEQHYQVECLKWAEANGFSSMLQKDCKDSKQKEKTSSTQKLPNV
ncbi:hypothetical protein L210DRAFT_3500262 [Boletus edulis BED1]|uniref:Uncharacterized protein n=1 Tax=Boletus edulis BED1 TaxID=1328754 RepID=A0AAD4GLF3_BOLED|nr:hypothetical protein L210DRAFT_3500262 [Boletus edulis BED1]